jgi:hypothetical protein
MKPVDGAHRRLTGFAEPADDARRCFEMEKPPARLNLIVRPRT